MKAPLLLLFPILCSAGELADRANKKITNSAKWEIESLFSGIQTLNTEFDLLHHSEVSVWRASTTYRQKREGWNFETVLGYGQIAIDYSDPVGGTSATTREEDSWSGGFTLGRDLTGSLSLSIGTSLYKGYHDYASVWISEYYDQFVGIPDSVLSNSSNYRPADPRGHVFNGSLVWDFDPGITRFSFGLSFAKDQIVPAWSFLPDPNTSMLEAEPTRSLFDTGSANLNWTQTINRSLRTQIALRLTDVTELEPRSQLQNDWAWAMTRNLTLRAQIGGAIQDPNFDASYGGLTLNYEIGESWSFQLAGRFYHDSGEIVPAGFNTAAPAIHSEELSASIAWQNLNTTIRLSGGIYDVDYDALPPANQFFSDLYRDRGYALARFAITHQF